MENITIEPIRDGRIEQCRDLCNELMALQKSRAVIDPERFDSMNFETRMKKSFEHALEKQVAVARDAETPVGYVFSTIDLVTERDRNAFPVWAPQMGEGFYPEWVKLPQKIGCLSNLYLRRDYRGSGLGAKLLQVSLEWLASFSDLDLIFVYISNGNEDALRFYLNYGFTYSHEVFGGFITAACKQNR